MEKKIKSIQFVEKIELASLTLYTKNRENIFVFTLI